MKPQHVTRLALVCLALMPLAVVATDLDVPATPTTIAALPAASGGVLALDLRGAFALALGRNLDLQVGRYDLALADTSIEQSGGIFDPELNAGVGGDFRRSPSATVLEGADVPESRNTRFSLGLGALLPTGGQVSLGAQTVRSETNSQFASLNPSWSSSLTASFRQPLLEGFGTTVTRAGILIAESRRDQTAAAFETSVVATLQQVESAYWDLAAARAAISVREQSLALAERLLDETRERVKVGTSAPIDLVQSEAGVASRRQALIVARNSAGNAEDALKALLGFDDPAEWLVPIETTEDYEAERLYPELRQAIDTALARRPEIRQQQEALSALELNTKLARNATLPSLNLRAGYGYSGLGGTLQSFQPLPEAKSGFSDSVSQVGAFDFPNWNLGLELSLPITNTDARARLAARRFEHDQGKVRLRALEQSVIRQVRIAVRALEDGAANVDAALASEQLAVRNLEAEQTKFANGLSTNFQVLQIQDDLAAARLSLIQAYLGYRQALASYLVATGTLLEGHHITIADPGAPDAPFDYWKDVRWLQFTDLRDAAARVDHPAKAVGEGS